MSTNRLNRVRLLSIAVAAMLLLPLSVSAGGEVEVTDACASGKCCAELMSMCGGTAGYYQDAGNCGMWEPEGDSIG